MFLQPALNTEPGLPSPQAIAYRPTQGALNFKSKGESQAEFEERERRCLATAIYFEARGELVEGQVAVGQVILNRVRSPQFPGDDLRRRLSGPDGARLPILLRL